MTCFARVREIFTAVESELQRGPHVVLQSLYAATHIIQVQLLLYFFNIDRKNRCDSYKKRGPCVLSKISIVAISVGLPVAVNNPVPATQVGFPCNLTRLRRRQQQTQGS